ncbi:MAG TPA: flagellar hook-basal body protein [Verrucomicrobiae bacterium]|nr:flagellar hook-basal body protein [Verrucomicrobiae bacterium]
MNVSLYQAAAAMNANNRWQDVITQNLGSSPIPGAKKQEVSFSAIQAGLNSVAGGPATNRILLPSSSTSYSFQQGQLRPTNVPTDLAIDGPGFLEVQLPNGTHGFSRDGELHTNAQGQLVTKQGYPVLGDGGPIQLDPSNHTPVSIAPTGEISQGGEAKGRIRLVEFSQPQLLTSIGGGYFLANSPQAVPAGAQSSQLRQGFLEEANTSPMMEMSGLITAMRGFEANQKVMQMQDDRMGRVITDLGATT